MASRNANLVQYEQVAPERDPPQRVQQRLGRYWSLYQDLRDLLGFWLPDGLALSGGAQDGAWQAGFLQGLAQALVDLLVQAQRSGRELRSQALLLEGVDAAVNLMLVDLWAHVAGVSVGSINAAGIALGWTPRKLAQLWLNVNTDNVVKRWPMWWLPPIGWLWAYFKGAAKSAEPLRRYLEKQLDPARHALKLHVAFRAGAVSLSDGQYKSCLALGSLTPMPPNLQAPCIVSREEMISWIMASSAHPLIMPAQLLHVGGQQHWFTDGGVINKTPLRDVAETGATNVLALVVSAPPEPVALPSVADKPAKRQSLLQRSLREFELILREAHRDDLRLPTHLAEHTGAHVVQPAHALPSELMNFDPTQSARLIKLGDRAARAWLARRAVDLPDTPLSAASLQGPRHV